MAIRSCVPRSRLPQYITGYRRSKFASTAALENDFPCFCGKPSRSLFMQKPIICQDVTLRSDPMLTNISPVSLPVRCCYSCAGWSRIRRLCRGHLPQTHNRSQGLFPLWSLISAKRVTGSPNLAWALVALPCLNHLVYRMLVVRRQNNH